MVGTVALVYPSNLSLRQRLAAALRHRSLYPSLYPWLIALAALDVLLTTLILSLGGTEANAIARAVLDNVGLPGMILLKLLSITFIIGVCQYAGRRRFRAGHLLAQIAIAANSAAVAVGCAALAAYSITVIAG